METIVVRHEIVGKYKQIQTTVRDYENGSAVGGPRKLQVIAPGDSTDGMPEDTIALANLLHTPSLIAEYQSRIEAPTLSTAKANKLSVIAVQRYVIETQGIIYKESGVEYAIATERQSVLNMDYYLEKLRAGMRKVFNWKCANDRWLEINRNNAGVIESRVLEHRTKCFDAEKKAQEDVMALDSVESVNAYVFTV